MLRSPLVILLILFGLLPLKNGLAQDSHQEFRTYADSILRKQYNSLQIFDGALRPYSNDSVLLNYFIEESRKVNQWESLSYGLNQKGLLYADAQDHRKAIRYYMEALEAAVQANNPVFRVYTLNMLASGYQRIDSIKRALDYFHEARLIGESVNGSADRILDEKGKTDFGIGKIYHSMGQFVMAIRFFEESAEHFEQSGNKPGLAATYGSLGECQEALGHLDQAVALYERSLEISESIGAEEITIISQAGLAHTLAHMERADEALRFLEPVLDQTMDMGNEELVSLVHIQLGWVLSHLDRNERAKDHLFKGLALAEELGNTPYQYDAHYFSYLILQEEGDFRNALYHYKQAQNKRNRIAGKTNRRYIYDALTKAEEAKWNSQIEILSREAEIANLQLRKNRNTLLIGALLLILFALMLYIIYRQYLQNSERKVMALEQSRLRSQMNPHFLFNSLNSIKHFIINNEQKNAITYLNKFSKLIRRILESSTTTEISLEEELKTVQLYMNIENIRFNENVDFKVEIAPEINPATVKIPSLILQPFLENALWHGLSTKEGEKQVRLIIRQDTPGVISLIIRDNGIGREASQVLQDQKLLKRKSLGISNTKRRLANFYRVYRNTFKIFIEDLYKEDGTANGTSVHIEIPVI